MPRGDGAVLIVLFVLGRTLCEALAQSFVLDDLVNSFLSSQSWKIFEIWSKKLSEAPEVCLHYAGHILRRVGKAATRWQRATGKLCNREVVPSRLSAAEFPDVDASRSLWGAERLGLAAFTLFEILTPAVPF